VGAGMGADGVDDCGVGVVIDSQGVGAVVGEE
jgi:hypothetical protein